MPAGSTKRHCPDKQKEGVERGGRERREKGRREREGRGRKVKIGAKKHLLFSM